MRVDPKTHHLVRDPDIEALYEVPKRQCFDQRPFPLVIRNRKPTKQDNPVTNHGVWQLLHKERVSQKGPKQHILCVQVPMPTPVHARWNVSLDVPLGALRLAQSTT